MITDRGTEFLERDVSLAEFESGSSPTPACEHAQWTRTGDRIDDFSQIDAETIKQFNYERYMDSEDSYGLVDGSREKTVRRIWNVQDLCLERVMREFPRRDPVVQQCAHWVRTISGKHFFPDANHRTAIGTLRAILELNDVPIPDRWPGEYIDHTILQAKFVRTFVVDVRFDTLWCRDELYHVWHRHFCTLFHDTDTAQQHDIPTPVLGRAFDAARNELSL
ncbi:hypothetical protein [Natronobiforma cellulositropha]|uniref:hypothetical protein n=1 Tax=Natronobiforma cellulositropha TaxID=1679076 RepID=UPI0021D5DB7F|nr:hypothetical protein [Natronobiforma cellulositropha]